MTYGVSAFLEAGRDYSETMDILARAEIACNREKTQKVSFPEG